MPVDVRPLASADRVAWDPLWRGYLDFYETALAEDVNDLTFARLTGDESAMGALVADDGGLLVGFAHYVVHPTTWTRTPACYLEDLFVASSSRGTGVGHALIDALATLARSQSWSGIHWITAADNAAGMRLYDRVAQRTTWVRYEIDLE